MWGMCKWSTEEAEELDIMELEALMCVLWIATLLDINPELHRPSASTCCLDDVCLLMMHFRRCISTGIEYA
jgi:hypothetical protein